MIKTISILIAGVFTLSAVPKSMCRGDGDRYQYKNWEIKYVERSTVLFVEFHNKKNDTSGLYVAGSTLRPLAYNELFSPTSFLKLKKVSFMFAYDNSTDSVYLYRGERVPNDRPLFPVPENCLDLMRFIDSICIQKTPYYTSQLKYFKKLYPVPGD